MVSQAKPLKRKSGGQPKLIDYRKVEKLASLGMPKKYVAEGLGISAGQMNAIENGSKDHVRGLDSTAFNAAFQRGIAKARVRTLKTIKKHSVKNFVPAMFMLKQQHMMGFSDNAQEVRHSGNVTINYAEGMLPLGQGKSKALEAPEDAIDADYEEVD